MSELTHHSKEILFLKTHKNTKIYIYFLNIYVHLSERINYLIEFLLYLLVVHLP